MYCPNHGVELIEVQHISSSWETHYQCSEECKFIQSLDPSPGDLRSVDVFPKPTSSELKEMITKEFDKAAAEVKSRGDEKATATLYYSDLADRLDAPLQEIVRACHDLMVEGKISVADEE